MRMNVLNPVKIIGVLVTLSLLSLFVSSALSEPVYFSGTGNYYEVVTASDPDWTAARAAAEVRSFMGVTGHLATIASAAENEFIVASFPEAVIGGYWLGGFQPLGSAEPSGNWQWITGESWSYTNWRSGEPNDWSRPMPQEDSLQFAPMKDTSLDRAFWGTWNDLTGVGIRHYYVDGYVVEYETHSVPEPCTTILLSFGFFGLAALRMRR